jgi:hypothetical protein
MMCAREGLNTGACEPSLLLTAIDRFDMLVRGQALCEFSTEG